MAYTSTNVLFSQPDFVAFVNDLKTSLISFRLDKAKARGYKIYTMKFFGYACLILLLALSLVPGAVKADG